MRREAFPSAAEAVFLVIALFLAEYLVGGLLYDARQWLGLEPRALAALTVLLANGAVLTLAMRLASVDYPALFHDGPSSVAATALLLPLVVALVPGLLWTIGWLMELLSALAPLSRWEEALFERFASGSLPMVVMVCVLAPVLEEMLFRGLVLRAFLQRYPRGPAIFASAILFGAAHLNLYQFVVGLVLGALLGWLYERTRSLVPCIGLHGCYNAGVMWYATAGRGTDAAPDGSAFGALAAFATSLPALLLLWRMLEPRGGKAVVRPG